MYSWSAKYSRRVHSTTSVRWSSSNEETAGQETDTLAFNLRMLQYTVCSISILQSVLYIIPTFLVSGLVDCVFCCDFRVCLVSFLIHNDPVNLNLLTV